VNFGLLTAEIRWRVWGTPAHFNGFRILAALPHGTLVVGVSQTLWHWTEGATYIQHGGHHVGHWRTFLVKFLRLTRDKTGHFRDVLPRRSLGLVLKKLNLTQQSKQHRNKLTKNTQIANLNLNKTNSQLHKLFICVCAYHCAQPLYTIQHRTVLIIFPYILRSVKIA